MIFLAVFWLRITTNSMPRYSPRKSWSVCYLSMILRYSFVYTILGNIFIFLVAGHEVRFKINFLRIISMVYVIKTTAHTLCFAFALLALYPEEQETLYQHIKSVLPGDRQPVSCDHNTTTVQLRRCLTGV